MLVLRLCSLILLIFQLSPLTPPAHAFVYENSAEFFTTGDFDANGEPDIVIVDRETGYYRIGYQTAPGLYNWTVETRASGLENVTGVSIGKLLSETHDALVLTGPNADRVQVIPAESQGITGIPVPVFADLIGPNMVVALNIGGAGDVATVDDLMIGSLWNDPGTSVTLLSFVRQLGPPNFDFQFLSDSVADQTARGNRVRLTSADTFDRAAVLVRGAVDDILNIYNLSTGPAGAPEVTRSGLPPGVDYAFGFFDPTSVSAHYIFYQPGLSADLRLRQVSGLSLGAEIVFPIGATIQQVFVLKNPGGIDRLLIIFDDGSAGVCVFDGINPPDEFSNPPILSLPLTPTAGAVFSGAAVLPNGDFTIFSDTDGSGRSQRAHPYTFDAFSGGYVSGVEAGLEALFVGAAPTTLLLFDKEPFVDVDLRLIRALQVRQWNSMLMPVPFVMGNDIRLDAERYVTQPEGLGDRQSAIPLGSPEPGEQYGLINQYRDDINVYSFAAAEGPRGVNVEIDPVPGLYDRATSNTFIYPAGYTVFYRLDLGDPWIPYQDLPFYLFQESTVYFFAESDTDDIRSAIQTATYRFREGPATLDSGGEGVPDYVEVDAELNPLGGSDSDGDGFSDLEETGTGLRSRYRASGFSPAAEPLRSSATTGARWARFLTIGARAAVSRGRRWSSVPPLIWSLRPGPMTAPFPLRPWPV